MPFHAEANAAAITTEEAVREALRENGWDTRMLQSRVASWDIEARKPKLYMAKKERQLLVEVKRRKMDWGQYPTVFIDVEKVVAMQTEAAIRMSDTVTCAPIFVVVPNDLRPRFAWLTPTTAKRWSTNTTDVQAHRNDPDDKGDVKYDIPLIDFHTLSL